MKRREIASIKKTVEKLAEEQEFSGTVGQKRLRQLQARLHVISLLTQKKTLSKALDKGEATADEERAFDMADKVRDRKEGKPTERHELGGLGGNPIKIEGVVIGTSDANKPFKEKGGT